MLVVPRSRTARRSRSRAQGADRGPRTAAAEVCPGAVTVGGVTDDGGEGRVSGTKELLRRDTGRVAVEDGVISGSASVAPHVIRSPPPARI